MFGSLAGLSSYRFADLGKGGHCPSGRFALATLTPPNKSMQRKLDPVLRLATPSLGPPQVPLISDVRRRLDVIPLALRSNMFGIALRFWFCGS